MFCHMRPSGLRLLGFVVVGLKTGHYMVPC
jgi:hypothetical protein